jgi:hypothetical protein
VDDGALRARLGRCERHLLDAGTAGKTVDVIAVRFRTGLDRVLSYHFARGITRRQQAAGPSPSHHSLGL